MNNKLKNLNLTMLKIDKKLTLHVQSYWEVKSILSTSKKFIIAPDGAMGLIVNLGDNIKINTENKNYNLKHGEIILLGIHEHAVSMLLKDNCSLIGIRFNPAGAFCFFKNYYHDLYQNNIYIKDINLLQKLQQNSNKIGDILNTYLFNLFEEDLKLNSFMKLLDKIEKEKGNTEIEDLAYSLNISRRSLDRLFKQYIGISANIYLRIIKIKYTREDLRNLQFESLTQVGYDNGYFDQSHFIKEFKTFMKKSPNEYVKEKKDLS